MADELKKIISIEIDQSAIKTSKKRATELSREIIDVKNSINEYKKATKGNTGAQKASAAQMVELQAKLKALQKEERQNINVLKQANAVNNAAEGSISKLRAQLSIVSTAWANLSKEERENTEEGRRLTKQKKELTEQLKAEEKATGDTRRNVGNYRQDIDEALEATDAFGSGLGGMVVGLKNATKASLRFLATPIGAVIGALALAVGAVVGSFKLFTESLNRTEEGSAALSKVTKTFSAIMNGVLKILEPLATTVMQGVADGFDAIGRSAERAAGFLQDGLRFFGLDEQAESVGNFTNAIEESVKGTRELADAQVELNRINREFQKIQLDYQNRAEKLRQIRDDEALSIEERKRANEELGEVLEEQTQRELELANRSLEIAQMRARVEGESTENLNAIAEAETKILEIEERINGQRSEQLMNINSLRRDEAALAKERAEQRQAEIEAAEAAEEEKIKAREEAFEKQRELIDKEAELKESKAIAEIANAEKRAERIAFIEREALLQKIANIDEETIAATAGAEMIGAADEERYAKQLAERAKYEAQLAEMDRAARADEFARRVNLLDGEEKLANQQAELEIENERELEARKAQIAVEFARKRMDIMREEAMLDDVLTEEEVQNIRIAENALAALEEKLNNPEAPTVADWLGLTEEDLEKLQFGLEVAQQGIQSVRSVADAAAENRIDNIDRETQAQINAVEQSTKSEEDKAQEIQDIEREAAREKYKVELQNFKISKGLQITNAIISSVQGALSAYASTAAIPIIGPALAPIAAGIAAAFGAVQVGVIASKKPPPPPQFEKGGVLRGKTHGQGGIPISVRGGGMIEAEDKEIILTKGVYQDPILRAKASALNVMGGGVPIDGKFEHGGLVRKFAAGGVATGSQAIMRESEATREIQQTIISQPPVLVLEEFQNVQGRQVRTEQNLQI